MHLSRNMRHCAAVLLLGAATPASAAVSINGSFAVPGDAASGNTDGEPQVLATGSASTCASTKATPAVNTAGSDRATSQHILINNGPRRCVNVTLTRTATSEALVVTYFASDGMVLGNPGTTAQYLADSGGGDGTGTVSFVAPAFSVIGATVQRKNGTATGSAITYTLASSELNASSNGSVTLDSSDPVIAGRLNRDGVNITDDQCRQGQNKTHPTLLDSGSTFRYRDHTLFNNGPARCVYAGIVRTSSICPVYVQAYAGSAPSNNLSPSANYLGDSGGSTEYQVAKFWAPQNTAIVLRLQQINPSGTGCTTTYTLTAPGLESSASAAPVCSLDIDNDGTYSATTDGLLLARALMGMSGTSVTSGAVGAGAVRNTWPEIRDFLRDACFLTVAD